MSNSLRPPVQPSLRQHPDGVKIARRIAGAVNEQRGKRCLRQRGPQAVEPQVIEAVQVTRIEQRERVDQGLPGNPTSGDPFRGTTELWRSNGKKSTD